jgi:hypothetical protein
LNVQTVRRLIHKPGDGVWFVEMEENHFVEPQTTR